MNAFNFWRKWLIVVGVLLIVFGLVISFFNQTAIFDILFNNQINPVFWGISSLDANAQSFQEWVYGGWGATVSGWGILFTFVAMYPFAEKARWSWIGLATAVGVWYILDSGLSLSAGVTFNAIFNTLLIILVAIPLIFTYTDFFGTKR